MTTPALSWKVVSACVVVPFIIGLLASSKLIPGTTYTEKEIIEPPASAPKIDMGGPTQRGVKNEAFDKLLSHKDPFANLASIQIHRNGQVDPCGSSAGSNIYEGMPNLCIQHWYVPGEISVVLILLFVFYCADSIPYRKV
jgi:hypothetical protein